MSFVHALRAKRRRARLRCPQPGCRGVPRPRDRRTMNVSPGTIGYPDPHPVEYTCSCGIHFSVSNPSVLPGYESARDERNP